MKIAFDIDGCLANFTSGYAELLTAHTGIIFPHQDPTFPHTWYWEREAGVTKEQETYVWNNHILQVGSKFWERLVPLEGTKQTCKVINNLTKYGNDCYFITHRMGHGAKLQTEKWLYNLGISYPTVIMTGNKLPVINSLGIEVFIDDKPETIGELAQGSIARLYIKSWPYNEYVHEDHRITRVKSVMEMLQKEGLA